MQYAAHKKQLEYDESYQDHVAEKSGGYKPVDYNDCPEGSELVQIGEGYICEQQDGPTLKNVAYIEIVGAIVILLLIAL